MDIIEMKSDEVFMNILDDGSIKFDFPAEIIYTVNDLHKLDCLIRLLKNAKYILDLNEKIYTSS